MVRAICHDVSRRGAVVVGLHAGRAGLAAGSLGAQGCSGTNGAAGYAFVAKIPTWTATCRQQHQPLLILTYVADAIFAYRAGRLVPSLLPNSRTTMIWLPQLGSRR